MSFEMIDNRRNQTFEVRVKKVGLFLVFVELLETRSVMVQVKKISRGRTMLESCLSSPPSVLLWEGVGSD